MMVEFQVFLLFLGAALLAAITPGAGMFYVAARPFADGRPPGLASAWAPVLAVCACYSPGRSGSLRSSWRVRKPSLCSSEPEPSIRSGLGQDMDERQDRRSGRGGDSRCGTGILARHYCRGAEPEDGCNFLVFTPHLLTQPPMSPGTSSSLGQFPLRSTQPPM